MPSSVLCPLSSDFFSAAGGRSPLPESTRRWSALPRSVTVFGLPVTATLLPQESLASRLWALDRTPWMTEKYGVAGWKEC